MGLVGISAALYFSLSPVSGLGQGVWSMFLFHPDYHCRDYSAVKQICGVKPQDIYFPSKNGRVLHAWYFDIGKSVKSEKKQILLVSHGNSGNIAGRTSVTLAALKSGSSVFLYDYEGYGKSQGSPSVVAIVNDGLAAYDYIKNKLGYRDKEIVLYGESLGTGVSCEIARQRNCAGVALQSGFSGLANIAREKIGLLALYPDEMFPQPNLHNAELVKTIKCPVLVMHGDDDKLIPLSHANTVYANAANKYALVVVKGGGHGGLYRANMPLMCHTIADFLGSIKKI